MVGRVAPESQCVPAADFDRSELGMIEGVPIHETLAVEFVVAVGEEL